MTGDGKELWRERVSTVMGRDITGNWETASRKEWLVTNGLGGFAAGTVAGANTRRYHGILVATLNPPVERLMVVAKLEVSVMYLGRRYDLSANEFDGGAVEPKGFVHIESFQLEGGIPTWRYAFEATVEAAANSGSRPSARVGPVVERVAFHDGGGREAAGQGGSEALCRLARPG